MKKILTTLAVSTALLVPAKAQAHLLKPFDSDSHKIVKKEYNHAKYVCVKGWGKPKKHHCAALPWLRGLVKETQPAPPAPSANYWIAKQIRVATIIGSEPGSNPWPNCPDPFHDGASWTDLVRCENHGSWYDSPGYFRCGLQFEPMWERKYGQLCP